jgi:D-glycero-alpha-D-manno-heptose-7-phosphate kinase
MIITRTPFRISLFGGGTDYPDWIARHGGAVLGLAINKYCYLSVRRLPPFFDHKHRIIYSQIESVKDIGEIQHPAVRAILSEMQVIEGIEIHHDGDLPARSGLGSSSSFTVGLLNAIYAFRGKRWSKDALAAEAIRIEQQVIGENVGCQDQMWAAYGGFNRIDFHPEGRPTVSPIIMDHGRRQELVDSLLLVFSGLSRIASDAAAEKINNMARNERQLLGLRQMVDEATGLITDGREPIRRVGALLHEAWMLKRGLSSQLMNQKVDEIYATAMASGAAGGKLLGAGGGGFLAFIVPPERRSAVSESLRGLVQVSVKIDTDGSRVMLYEPDEEA